jgi:hypothetical protein
MNRKIKFWKENFTSIDLQTQIEVWEQEKDNDTYEGN